MGRVEEEPRFAVASLFNNVPEEILKTSDVLINVYRAARGHHRVWGAPDPVQRILHKDIKSAVKNREQLMVLTDDYLADTRESCDDGFLASLLVVVFYHQLFLPLFGSEDEV